MILWSSHPREGLSPQDRAGTPIGDADEQAACIVITFSYSSGFFWGRRRAHGLRNTTVIHYFWAVVSLLWSPAISQSPAMKGNCFTILGISFSQKRTVSEGKATLGSLCRVTVLTTSQLLADWVSKLPALAENKGTRLSATAQQLLQVHLHFPYLHPN